MSGKKGVVLERRPLFARLGDKVNFDGDNGCWEFTGGLNRGYGQITVDHTRRSVKAHRAMFENVYGPIPEGLVLDHVCRNTRCVNPDHLEPVTQAENLRRSDAFSAVNARKTHCIHGHPFDAGNTYINREGERVCRTCQRANGRVYDAKRRAARRALKANHQ